jgi:hypothetical protein
VLQGSRTRLETALNNADQLVGRLRAQLDDATQRELESGDPRGRARADASPHAFADASSTPPPQ